MSWIKVSDGTLQDNLRVIKALGGFSSQDVVKAGIEALMNEPSFQEKVKALKKKLDF